MRFLLILSLLFYAAAFAALIFDAKRKGQGKAGLFCRIFIAAGLVAHGAVVAARAVSAGRLPVASAGETLLFYAFVAAGISLIVITRYGEKRTSLITLPLAFAALVMSIVNLAPPRSLPLILKTYWFELHVVTSFIAYAMFTLAFSGGIVAAWLKKKGAEQAATDGARDITLKSVLWGFFFFSASMFAGAIWGYLAWGAYWMWEPKIIWSFIVWFWYAGAIHVWYVKDWREKWFAPAAILGFFVTLFTYLGVGMLMKSSHSF